MQSKIIVVLYELSKKIKFKGTKTFFTTRDLGNFLGVSQQSASRYLKELEEKKLIKRKITGRGQWVGITEEGTKVLKGLYQNLRTFLDFKPQYPKILRGTVASGIEEGAYYIKTYSEKIEKKLGFKPYPGTLNVKLQDSTYSKGEIIENASLKIKEFLGKDRVFGDILLTPAKIFLKGNNKGEEGYIIIPQRTHHQEDEIELIHPENLRKKFNLKDGDEIGVKIES